MLGFERQMQVKAALTTQADIPAYKAPPAQQNHEDTYPEKGEKPGQVEIGKSLASLEVGIWEQLGNCFQILIQGGH